MKLLAGAAALSAIAVAASAVAFAGRTAGEPSRPATVHSSALIFHGRVRCFVSVGTPAQLGRDIRVRFRYRNVSSHAIRVDFQNQGPWLVIKGSDGRKYDTRVGMFFPSTGPVPPRRIAPGKAVTATLLPLRARWSGPLQITPGCNETSLPKVEVAVAQTVAPTSPAAAVATVVAASGHLLDQCRPLAPGVPVDGVLVAPHGAAPPMRARCSVRLVRGRGFYLAQELIVSPPGLQVRVGQPYDGLTWPRRQNRNTEAVAWEFVVTRGVARTVASSAIYTTKRVKHRHAPAWDWVGSGPKGPSDGGGICWGSGSSGSSWGGFGPTVVWVSACHR